MGPWKALSILLYSAGLVNAATTYGILTSNGLCLGLQGGATVAGTQVVQETCATNATEQAWSIATNQDGSVTFLSALSGMVLEAAGFGTANGTKIDAYTSLNQTNQRWIATQASTAGTYTIRSVGNNLCLDIPANMNSVGLYTQCWSCSGAAQQQFTFKLLSAPAPVVAPTLPTAPSAIKTSAGQCLEVQGGASANGVVVVSTACTYSPQQLWTVQAASGATGYTLASALNGKLLDIYNSVKTTDATVDVWDPSTSGSTYANQLWVPTPSGSSWRLVAQLSGSCLDATASSPAVANTCTSAATQLFSFAAPPPAPSGTVPKTAVNIKTANGLCLEVSGGATGNGVLVSQNTCNGLAQQSWLLAVVAGSSKNYTVASVLDGNLLEVYNSVSSNGAAIDVWQGSGTSTPWPNQAWTLIANGSAFTFVSSLTGNCLDIAGNSASVGQAAQTWSCNGFAQQQFTLATPPPAPAQPPGPVYSVIGSYSGTGINSYAGNDYFSQQIVGMGFRFVRHWLWWKTSAPQTGWSDSQFDAWVQSVISEPQNMWNALKANNGYPLWGMNAAPSNWLVSDGNGGHTLPNNLINPFAHFWVSAIKVMQANNIYVDLIEVCNECTGGAWDMSLTASNYVQLVSAIKSVASSRGVGGFRICGPGEPNVPTWGQTSSQYTSAFAGNPGLLDCYSVHAYGWEMDNSYQSQFGSISNYFARQVGMGAGWMRAIKPGIPVFVTEFGTTRDQDDTAFAIDTVGQWCGIVQANVQGVLSWTLFNGNNNVHWDIFNSNTQLSNRGYALKAIDNAIQPNSMLYKDPSGTFAVFSVTANSWGFVIPQTAGKSSMTACVNGSPYTGGSTCNLATVPYQQGSPGCSVQKTSAYICVTVSNIPSNAAIIASSTTTLHVPKYHEEL